MMNYCNNGVPLQSRDANEILIMTTKFGHNTMTVTSEPSQHIQSDLAFASQNLKFAKQISNDQC